MSGAPTQAEIQSMSDPRRSGPSAEQISDAAVQMMGQDRIEKIGQIMLEQVVETDRYSNPGAQKLAEALRGQGIRNREDLYRKQQELNSQAEDLQFGNNSTLYTTAVTSFVSKELRSALVTRELINELQLQQGQDSIKVPKGTNKTATQVSNDGTVSDDSNDYGTKSISTDLWGVRDVFTLELGQVSNIDVMADQLEELGRAIALKIDDQILAELQDATDPTGTYGDNGNYNYLGSSTTITHDNLVQEYNNSIANKMTPTDIVAGTGITGDLMANDEFSDHMNFDNTASPAGDLITPIGSILNATFHVSANVSADSLFFVDRNRLGYFVEGGPVQTFDARINSKAAFEVMAVKRFGVGLDRPNAVYQIAQNEATPT